MPRFFGKKGPRGGSRAGAKARPKRKSAPRRKLGAVASYMTAKNVGTVARVGYGLYEQWNAQKTKDKRKAKSAFVSRLNQTDGITTAPAVKIGVPRKISFAEKVSKSQRPPLLFKRNYGFSAECISGRKGWFSMEVNVMNDNDLQKDITTYKSQQFSDTTSIDAQITQQAPTDNARFYVDYHSEKIQMMNSSSNSITGKVHLIAHRRDNDNSFSSVGIPITPINLMMYYASATTNSNLSVSAGGAGNTESTVGNGWLFSATAGNTNYGGVFNMPGSSINTSGFTASTDPELSLSSNIIKDRMGFWFRKVSTSDFSLKPGQQFNASYIFNDLPKIFREEQVEYVHLAGVSYSIVVEFKAGVVGSSVAISGNNIISTGDAQLSVIRESKRIVGVENYLRPKMLLQTPPLASIAIEAQVIINADTGVGLIGTIVDA